MTVRVHDSGYQLDTSSQRLDLDRIERWLATESYWALGRERAVITRSLAGSTVYGLYAPVPGAHSPDVDGAGGVQVGLFRVVTDHATFAWLCDVFIDSAHRGRGLATWAVTHIRDDLLSDGIYRVVLATVDAHGVYAKVGFTAPAEPQLWMELKRKVVPTP